MFGEEASIQKIAGTPAEVSNGEASCRDWRR